MGWLIVNLEVSGVLEAILNRTPGVAPTIVIVLELLLVVDVAVPTRAELAIIVVIDSVISVKDSVPSASYS